MIDKQNIIEFKILNKKKGNHVKIIIKYTITNYYYGR